jgi:hypothetical protein
MTQENRAKQLAEEAIAYYSNFIIHLLVCRTLAIHLYQEKKKSCIEIIHSAEWDTELRRWVDIRNPEYTLICEVIKYLETLLK